jgi:hypothetical protein
MRRPTWMLLLVLALCALPNSVTAQKFSQQTGTPSRLISPAGLGPDYSGLLGVGIGLQPSTAEFGIEAGDFVVQPRLFLEAAYTTNFYREDLRSRVSGLTTELSDVFMLKLRPGIGMYNPGFSKVAVTAGIDANIRVPLSGSQTDKDLIDVGGVAHMAVSFFPKGPFTFVLHEQFRRDLWNRPASTVANANRNKNKLGADMVIKPGGGAIEFTLGYDWDIDRYDDASNMDVDQHRFRLLGSWRFYPLSYVFIESTFNMLDYPNAAPESEGSLGNYRAATPVRASAGLSGYFTERVALLVRLGYGNSLLEEQLAAPDNFEMLVGMAQLSFRFGPGTVLHVGGAHDFETVIFGGYRSYFRGYASLDQRLGGFGMLHIDAAYDYRDYGLWSPYPYDIPNAGELTPQVSESQRNDSRIRAGMLVDFNVHRAFGITLGYRYDTVLTDFNIVINSAGYDAKTFTGYDEHRIFTTLNVRY